VVATVLRLRYRSLGNTLARRPWQLVGFCFGILWAVGLLVAVVAGLIALSIFHDLTVARTVAVLGGSALLLGWVLGPVLIAGMETTVDAEHLAPFPLRTTQIMHALTAIGLTGIPGIITSAAAVATIVLWMRWPAAALFAIVCVVVAVLTCVLATRLMASLSAGLGGDRRGREIIGTVVLVLLIMSGPILTGVIALLDDAAGGLAGRFAQISEILGWTPLGAAWAAPGDAAAGSWLGALAKLAIAAATLALLWVLWARALESSITSPPHRAARVSRAGSLGLFGRMPTGGVGATWARALTAWLRDPRYLRQLLVIPLLPLLFGFTAGVDSWLFAASALLVALVLSIAGYADISYDGTAFASVLSTGIRGRDDRLGRLLGAACVGVPLTVLVATVTAVLPGSLERLPAVLGGSLGILLGGYAVTAVSSALIVTPVAAAGDSPFKSVPGQNFVNGLLVFVVWGASLVLAAPALVFSVAAFVTDASVLGWISLGLAIAVGLGAVAAGVVLGGRTLDRTGPDLLQRIKAFPI
jgi:ABC-2 type transport system permease protein